jgi:N6-adenosine-specific RNA methylase IME4
MDDRDAVKARIERINGNLESPGDRGRHILRPPAGDNPKLVKLPHFTLLEDGLEIIGEPTIRDYVGAGNFILYAEHGSPFWFADWLNYGDTRPEWADLIGQKIDMKGYSPETISRYKRTAKNVPLERRRSTELSFLHHQAIEGLEPDDQVAMLDAAVSQGWNVAELRREVRVHKRAGSLVGQAMLAGMFKVFYIDPPWLYNDRGVINETDNYGRADRHYDGMTIEQLCKLPVQAHALRNAVLFLWVTSPMLSTCWPVIEAWGFDYKTGIVWDKVLHNFGHYVSVRHEHLLICTRGSCTPDRPTPMPDSVQTVRRTDVHSEKPEEFRRLIEQLYDGPYVEMFARRPREGWTTWGNQVLARTLEEVSA